MGQWILKGCRGRARKSSSPFSEELGDAKHIILGYNKTVFSRQVQNEKERLHNKE
jgi:hypothetical protein